jgi:CBS domain-containing protein
LQEHIRLEFRDHETVIPLLANDTLAHWPPLTFFRGLVLELDGAQHDSFDISDAVVSPIANAARVFAIAKRRLAQANTLARLETALLDFPEGADILREAADAFRIGLYYQTLAGTRIEPGKLGKFDRLLLKTAFSSIQRFLEFTVSTFIPAS